MSASTEEDTSPFLFGTSTIIGFIVLACVLSSLTHFANGSSSNISSNRKNETNGKKRIDMICRQIFQFFRSVVTAAFHNFVYYYGMVLREFKIISLQQMAIGKEKVSKAFPLVGRLVNDESILRLIQKEVSDLYETYRTKEISLGHYQQVGFSSKSPQWTHLGLSTGIVVADFLSRQCPVLSSLLENFTDQGYSIIVALLILRPGPDIPPHIDTSSAIRRVHVPIIVPNRETNGHVTMTIDGKSFDVTEFEPYFFDQELVHSVTNRLKASSKNEDPNDVIRINLMIDIFVPTKWRWLNFLHKRLYEIAIFFFARNHIWSYDMIPASESASLISKLTSQPIKKTSSGWNGSLFMLFFRETVFHQSNMKKIMNVIHNDEENKELSNWMKNNFSSTVMERFLSSTVSLYHSIKSRIYISTMSSTINLRLIEIWAERIISGHGGGSTKSDNDDAAGCDPSPVGIPGGFLEAGVWRGGDVIFMKYLSDKLSKQQQQQPPRPVYALDCYGGMKNGEHSNDDDDDVLMNKNYCKLSNIARRVLNNDKEDFMTTSLEEVKENFEYLLGPNILADSKVYDSSTGNSRDRENKNKDRNDEEKKNGVIFVKGWMDDPNFDWDVIGSLSMIRLNLNYYKPTKIALSKLYDKLSIGGIMICENYNWNCTCGYIAIDEFRAEWNITSPLIYIGTQSAYWIKKVKH